MKTTKKIKEIKIHPNPKCVDMHFMLKKLITNTFYDDSTEQFFKGAYEVGGYTKSDIKKNIRNDNYIRNILEEIDVYNEKMNRINTIDKLL